MTTPDWLGMVKGGLQDVLKLAGDAQVFVIEGKPVVASEAIRLIDEGHPAMDEFFALVVSAAVRAVQLRAGRPRDTKRALPMAAYDNSVEEARLRLKDLASWWADREDGKHCSARLLDCAARLETWTCSVCARVHPYNHGGLFCVACQLMAACQSCESKFVGQCHTAPASARDECGRQYIHDLSADEVSRRTCALGWGAFLEIKRRSTKSQVERLDHDQPRLAVERLDYSKEPPDGLHRCCAPTCPGLGWRASERAHPCPSSVHDAQAAERLKSEARKLAWLRHKERHGPPGMVVLWEPDDQHFEPLGSGEWVVETRLGGPSLVVWHAAFSSREAVEGGRLPSNIAHAAAWAWFDDALEVAKLLDDRLSVLEYGDDVETVGDDIRRRVAQRVETTIAGLFAAVAPMVYFNAEELDEHEREAVQHVVDELLETGRATFEGDASIELVRFNSWPHALAWTAEQRAGVRRWASEGGELPEVLRV